MHPGGTTRAGRAVAARRAYRRCQWRDSLLGVGRWGTPLNATRAVATNQTGGQVGVGGSGKGRVMERAGCAASQSQSQQRPEQGARPTALYAAVKNRRAPLPPTSAPQPPPPQTRAPKGRRHARRGRQAQPVMSSGGGGLAPHGWTPPSGTPLAAPSSPPPTPNPLRASPGAYPPHCRPPRRRHPATIGGNGPGAVAGQQGSATGTDKHPRPAIAAAAWTPPHTSWGWWDGRALPPPARRGPAVGRAHARRGSPPYCQSDGAVDARHPPCKAGPPGPPARPPAYPAARAHPAATRPPPPPPRSRQ